MFFYSAWCTRGWFVGHEFSDCVANSTGWIARVLHRLFPVVRGIVWWSQSPLTLTVRSVILPLLTHMSIYPVVVMLFICERFDVFSMVETMRAFTSTCEFLISTYAESSGLQFSRLFFQNMKEIMKMKWIMLLTPLH